MEITSNNIYNYSSSGLPELREDSLRKTASIPDETRQQDTFHKTNDSFTPGNTSKPDVYSFVTLPKSTAKPDEKQQEVTFGISKKSDDASTSDNQTKPTAAAEKKSSAEAGSPQKADSSGSAGKQQSIGGEELSEEEQAQVDELKKIDQAVRAHEAAHLAAGAGLVRGGASFSYVSGPDGKRYAVGGEVSIDTSEVSGDPRATIRKMDQVRGAALAPVDPSAQDRAVAAAASQMAARAQMELLKENTEKIKQAANSEGDGSQANGASKSEVVSSETIDIPANKAKIPNEKKYEENSVLSVNGKKESNSEIVPSEFEKSFSKDKRTDSNSEIRKRTNAYNSIAVSAYKQAENGFSIASGINVNAFVY